MSRRIDSTSIGVHLVPGRVGWTTILCPYAGLIKMALVLPALLEYRTVEEEGYVSHAAINKAQGIVDQT